MGNEGKTPEGEKEFTWSWGLAAREHGPQEEHGLQESRFSAWFTQGAPCGQEEEDVLVGFPGGCVRQASGRSRQRCEDSLGRGRGLGGIHVADSGRQHRGEDTKMPSGGEAPVWR